MVNVELFWMFSKSIASIAIYLPEFSNNDLYKKEKKTKVGRESVRLVHKGGGDVNGSF